MIHRRIGILTVVALATWLLTGSVVEYLIRIGVISPELRGSGGSGNGIWWWTGLATLVCLTGGIGGVLAADSRWGRQQPLVGAMVAMAVRTGFPMVAALAGVGLTLSGATTNSGIMISRPEMRLLLGSMLVAYAALFALEVKFSIPQPDTADDDGREVVASEMEKRKRP